MSSQLSPRPEHHLGSPACRVTYIDLNSPKPQLPLSNASPSVGIPVSPASSENSRNSGGAQPHEVLSPAFCYPREDKRISGAMQTPMSRAGTTPRPSHMDTDGEAEDMRRQEWERQMAVEQSEKTQALAAREQAVSEREALVAEKERLLLVQLAALQEKEAFLMAQSSDVSAPPCNTAEIQTEPETEPVASEKTASCPQEENILSPFGAQFGVEALVGAVSNGEIALARLRGIAAECTVLKDITQTVEATLKRPKQEPLLLERLSEAQKRFAAVQAIRSSRPGPGQAKDLQFQASLDGLEDVMRFLAESYALPSSAEQQQEQPEGSTDQLSLKLDACKEQIHSVRVASRVLVDRLEQAVDEARRVGNAVEAADEDAPSLRSKMLRMLNVVYREYVPLINSYTRMKETVVRRNERRVSQLRKVLEGMVEVDPSAGPLSEEMHSTVNVLDDQQKHLRKYFEQRARVSGFVETLLETAARTGRDRDEELEQIEQLAKRPRHGEDSPVKEKPSFLGRVANFVWG